MNTTKQTVTGEGTQLQEIIRLMVYSPLDERLRLARQFAGPFGGRKYASVNRPVSDYDTAREEAADNQSR